MRVLQVQDGRLEGALEWAMAHRQQLSSSGAPTQLEFKLRRLAYLDLLKREGMLTSLAGACAAQEGVQPADDRNARVLHAC